MLESVLQILIFLVAALVTWVGYTIVTQPDSTIAALAKGILNRRRTQKQFADAFENTDLDGRLCLITGANRGLGKGIAVSYAKAGARLILACRSGLNEAVEEVRRESGNTQVEGIQLDLSDFSSIEKTAQELKRRGEVVEVFVNNAGVVTQGPRTSKHGFELQFAVNFLGTCHFTRRCLDLGVIANRTFAKRGRASRDPGRIIMVSSESHRHPKDCDKSLYGKPTPYGLLESLEYYGLSKQLLNTWTYELSRRVSADEVCVVSMCPGAVATDIAREAPAWLQAILRIVFKLIFKSPHEASAPLLFLADTEDLDGRTGEYYHMFEHKRMSEFCYDEANGQYLWDLVERLPNLSR